MTPILPALVLLAALAQPSAPKPPAAPTSPTPPALPAAPMPPAEPSDIFASRTPTTVASGYQFVEGPTWVPAAGGSKGAHPGFLIFCEYPSATVYKLEASIGAKAEPFRKDSGGAVGSAMDAQGRFYFCEVKARRITRATLNQGGTWSDAEVLADKFNDLPLNDTNDMVVTPGGDVYFTDPTFFNRGEWKQPHKGLYRISSKGELTLADSTLKLPNGVALSPDAKTLYVNEFGEQKVLAFTINADGTLSDKRTLAELKSFGKGTRGGADGLKVDAQGRIFTTGPGGVYVLSPAGELVDFLSAPGLSNVCLGGDDGKSLYMTAGGKVMMVPLK